LYPPETSRVIDGLSLTGDFVYFINKNDSSSALAHHNQLPEADVSRYSLFTNITGSVNGRINIAKGTSSILAMV
jgi:hypothetical protein